MLRDRPFSQILFIDFEFYAPPGERPLPLCVSTLELHSGKLVRAWLEGESVTAPPFEIDEDTLMVAFLATAEISCFLVLGWPVPAYWLDLYVEERVATNGMLFDPGHSGRGLLEVLHRHGIPHTVTAQMKEEMRGLAIRGGPFTETEKVVLMDYCDTDVHALRPLYEARIADINLEHALYRGRYMRALADIELRGTPIDTSTLGVFNARWSDIQQQTAMVAAARFEGVYEGTSFSEAKFERYLGKRGIRWPRHLTGRLKLDEDTFADMIVVHPRLQFLLDARKMLRRLQVGTTVGRDGRNRCMLSAFSTKTGRNSPSTSAFIFGASRWLRSLIRPEPEVALAYVDWQQQEFGIAAAMSGDLAMQQAYASGDPYLAFAVQAGAAPADATKASHGEVRNIYKTVTLAVGYGQSARSLGDVLGIPSANAAQLLHLHRRTYSQFWRWSDDVSATGKLTRRLGTGLGWQLHVTPLTDIDRSIRNFPVQAMGAELLRLACILALERGLRICAPVHDALLVEAPIDEIDEAVIVTQTVMRDASELLLDGFSLRTDADVIVRHPDRYPVTDTWTEVLAMVGLGR